MLFQPMTRPVGLRARGAWARLPRLQLASHRRGRAARRRMDVQPSRRGSGGARPDLLPARPRRRRGARGRHRRFLAFPRRRRRRTSHALAATADAQRDNRFAYSPYLIADANVQDAHPTAVANAHRENGFVYSLAALAEPTDAFAGTRAAGCSSDA
ncbi:hypothetical protein DFH09DRAFT_1283511, partial [Mycena vulgaris]